MVSWKEDKSTKNYPYLAGQRAPRSLIIFGEAYVPSLAEANRRLSVKNPTVPELKTMRNAEVGSHWRSGVWSKTDRSSGL